MPLGLVDKPHEQRRDPLVVDLSAAAGHAVIVGGPRSGKSTAVRTLVSALALTHTPREVQFYCLDFGGGSLAGLRDLPHVGGVAARLDVGAVRRTVAEVLQLLTNRERVFADHGVEGMAAYRERRAAGEFAADPWGDVFLMVDGWSVLRSDFEELEMTLAEIAGRGLAYGVHVVATCSRWFDLRGTIRDLFGTKIELRLGDPSDSMVDRKAAMSVPAETPGRGLTDKAQHFVVATPDADLAPQLAAAWPVSGAPRVRLLPVQLQEAELSAVLRRCQDAGDQTPAGLPVGLAERDLGPAYVDFDADPHLLVFGDNESGKTGLVRWIARSLTRRYEPTEARIILVDYRRSVGVQATHVMGTFSEPRSVEKMVAELGPVLDRRLSGEWTGPQIHILVDDYDLVAGQTSNPLNGLVDYLAHGRDIGLHLVLTRRSGGAGRAIYEPLIARLRDLGTPGLLLSGDRAEGPLLGTVRPQPLPPGRAQLVTRRGDANLIQLVNCPPATEENP